MKSCLKVSIKAAFLKYKCSRYILWSLINILPLYMCYVQHAKPPYTIDSWYIAVLNTIRHEILCTLWTRRIHPYLDIARERVVEFLLWLRWSYVTTRYPWQWRHNGRYGVSNNQPHDCLLNHLFRHRSKKTPKLRVTGLCAGNSPVTGKFPAQVASNAENVSIWWRHHVENASSLWYCGVLTSALSRYWFSKASALSA